MAFCPRVNFLTWPRWCLSVLASSLWFVSTAPVVKEQPSPTPECPREGHTACSLLTFLKSRGRSAIFRHDVSFARECRSGKSIVPSLTSLCLEHLAPFNLSVLTPESAPGGAPLPKLWPLLVSTATVADSCHHSCYNLPVFPPRLQKLCWAGSLAFKCLMSTSLLSKSRMGSQLSNAFFCKFHSWDTAFAWSKGTAAWIRALGLGEPAGWVWDLCSHAMRRRVLHWVDCCALIVMKFFIFEQGIATFSFCTWTCKLCNCSIGWCRVRLTSRGPNQSVTRIAAYSLKSPAKLDLCILRWVFLGSKSVAFIRAPEKFRAIVTNNNKNN